MSQASGIGAAPTPFFDLPEIPFDPKHPVAVLADLHANLEAVSAVARWLEAEGIHQVLVLGDLVGYGASPSEVLDLVREKGWPCVLGNHDLWAADPAQMEVPYRRIKDHARQTLEWTYRQLDSDQHRALLALPKILRLGSAAIAVHGSLVDPDHCFAYIYDLSLYLNIRYLKGLSPPDRTLVWFGHTHKPTVFSVEGETWGNRSLHSAWTTLDAPTHFVNPGSVGYPRDGDSRAAFALWDPTRCRLRGVRLPYPIDRSADRMRAAGLPRENVERLLAAR